MNDTNKELWQRALEAVGEDTLHRRFRSWISSLIRTAERKSKNLSAPEHFLSTARIIIDDLNSRTNSRFTLSDHTLHIIRHLIAAGYSAEDFFHVHEVKSAKWLNDTTMRDYLRPSTLYRPSHFDEYLAEYYAMISAQADLAAKRQASQARLRSPAEKKDQTIINSHVSTLLSRPWHTFDSWADFMRYTLQFPDAQSIDRYVMPPRIRKMRTAPGMLSQVIRGNSPQWAEDEYAQLKKEHTHDTA